MSKDLMVYVCLLVLAGIQFLIAYQSISPGQMFTRMLVVAVIEASLALLLFMHLADNRGLLWFVVILSVRSWPCNRLDGCFRLSSGGSWANQGQFQALAESRELMRPLLKSMGLASVALSLVLSTAPAFSQSCALCYTQAASSGSRMIQALKSGILVLIVPPTLGSIGMIFVVYRKRNQVRDSGERDEIFGD